MTEIVIKISKALYNRILDKTHSRADLQHVCGAVVYGTPLPEHHGRLIDADVLIDEMPTDICDGYEAIDVIERTSTIIEGSDSE